MERSAIAFLAGRRSHPSISGFEKRSPRSETEGAKTKAPTILPDIFNLNFAQVQYNHFSDQIDVFSTLFNKFHL